MKVFERKRAFALYLGTGLSLAQVAKDVGVSKSSIERWSKEDGWHIRRKRAWLEASQKALEESTNRMISEKVTSTGQFHNLMKYAHSQHQLYREGKLPKKALKYSARELSSMIKAMAVADFVYQKAMVEKVLEEKIKRHMD